MTATTIEWADYTFNPWWGCTHVGPGCDHCYAETWARRFGVQWGPGQPRRPASEKYWKQPRAWALKAKREGRKRRVFCASMADVFDLEAPEGARERLWPLIEETAPYLDWLLLTKRSGNAAKLLPPEIAELVWLGATVCNQEEANRDIPKLLATPAAVRFLSAEPLLGEIKLEKGWLPPKGLWEELRSPIEGSARRINDARRNGWTWLDWVIVGGESGPRARPMHPDWVRGLRDQCQAAGVAFFFKQWGAWYPATEHHYEIGDSGTMLDDGTSVVRVGKARAGRTLDGREWNEFPGTK
ncbi:MAG: phage Gp37/Gp68 family protein [Patescibacteria group bacterium]|nr:phage Gp37/Gp68 family protein [Patescibacteria group bacterium]